ncbi:RICIN domain-containing protein [Actinokineospora inagensis]|uniref:RICIN domain-containing protein n=1 Tax=Actinokineospora inagensis TaxID=103730 RepID=UPI000418E66E|nr:RICIN domain-containing protein [Actinokineospora inagensis]
MEFRRKITGVLLGAAALTTAIAGSGVAVAQAAPSPTSQVTPFATVFNPIVNFGDRTKCMSAPTPAVNTAVIEARCDGSDAQSWEVKSFGTNIWQFLNKNGTGFCLFAFSPPPRNGAPMGLNNCRTVSNEEFNTHTSSTGFVSLESRTGFTNTGFCVDVPGGATAPYGEQLELFQCNGSQSQSWHVVFP